MTVLIMTILVGIALSVRSTAGLLNMMTGCKTGNTNNGLQTKGSVNSAEEWQTEKGKIQVLSTDRRILPVVARGK